MSTLRERLLECAGDVRGRALVLADPDLLREAAAALERVEALEAAAIAVVRSVSIGGNGKANVPIRYLTGLEDALLSTPAPAGAKGGEDGD